jgi:hypothetical protein
MRLSHCLIFVGAMSIAVPAVAQDNAAAPVNAADNMVVDANADAPAAAPTTTTATTETQETTSSAAPAPAPAQRSFPWGVLGILGLIGLFGVRKVKG